MSDTASVTSCWVCGMTVAPGGGAADCPHDHPLCPRCGGLREDHNGDCPACGWETEPADPRAALESDGYLLRTQGTGSSQLHRDVHLPDAELCPKLRGARRDPIRVEAPAGLPLRGGLCAYCGEVAPDD